MNDQRALFLDRDGVINVDHGYVCLQEQFEFIDGIFDLCRHARELGYLIFVVTNQAGIGRGLYTEQDFLLVTEWMCEEFRKRAADINKVYFCPYHPDEGIGDYRRASSFRKPEPGMILAAAEEFNLSLEASLLIGDKEIDIQAGMKAGIGLNIMYRPIGDNRPTGKADVVIASLIEAKPLLGKS